MTKKCFKCGQTKALCEFYRHKHMVDGHVGKCKECARLDMVAYRNKNLDYLRAYDNERNKLPHRVKHFKENTRKYRKQFPLRYATNTLLNNAVRDGKITKSPICTNCGVDGLIQGHHKDYYKPLEVIWLCVICHKQQHKADRINTT